MSNGPTQLHAVLSLPPLLRECINILAVPLPTTTHASTCYCNSVERSRYQMTNAYTARRNGIAKFRLICKQASEAGMQAVTGYCLRLSPLTPAGKAPEPLLEVARLLCKTNLQHLQVEVQISTGFPSLKDSIHRISQLEGFLSGVGTALEKVTSLTFRVLGSKTHNTDNPTTRCPMHLEELLICNSCRTPPQIFEMEGASIATLISKTCPLISSLGVGGGVGLPALQVFGTSINSLKVWELLDAGIPLETLQTAINSQMLPGVSTVKLFRDPGTIIDYQGLDVMQSAIVAVCGSSTLTKLDLTHSRLGAASWRALPVGLKLLHLCDENLDIGYRFPSVMRLGNLHHLILDSVTPGITHMACILQAAPLLKRVSNRSSESHDSYSCLTINEITQEELDGMHLLGQCLEAGLEFNVGLNVVPKMRFGQNPEYDMTHTPQHVKDVLRQLPCLPRFTRCTIYHSRKEYDDEEDPSLHLSGLDLSAPTCTLSHIAKVLPDVTHLCMQGLDFTVAETLQLSAGIVLQQLNLFDIQLGGYPLTVAALVTLIVEIPSLQQLLHDADCISTKELQEMLSTARSRRARDECDQLWNADKRVQDAVWEVANLPLKGKIGQHSVQGWCKQGFMIKDKDIYISIYGSTTDVTPSPP